MNLIGNFRFLLSFFCFLFFFDFASAEAKIPLFQDFHKEVFLPKDAIYQVVDFPFLVKKGESVVFRASRSDCSCVQVDFVPRKKVWSSGEEGILRATFRVDRFLGDEIKEILLWFRNEGFPVRLQVEFKVSREILFAPQKLEWKVGEIPQKKKIEFSLKNSDISLNKLRISPKNRFSYTLQKMPKGKYHLWVLPEISTMKKPSLSVLNVFTDSSISREKKLPIFLSIKR